ncbi:hypothetical protein [Bradyrhizobium sp. BR 1433]|uniref:hypothetical protein n=1 Tax=Bradyrhizobium sp. BR 1433 TaxID=3447967 RepID=UPI003EE49761
MAVAQISSLDSFRSGRRLAALLRGHDDVAAAVQTARAALQRTGWFDHLAVWDEAVHALFEANLGQAVVQGFLRLSEQWPAQRSADDLIAIGRAVRDIGCSAGSRVAHALLTELSKVLPRLAGAGELTAVLAALDELAATGPDSAGLAIGRLGQFLAHAGGEEFAAWVSAGLRASGGRASRRRAYFALDDQLSAQLFAAGRSGDDFARLEKRLAATTIALWNRKPRFRKLAVVPAPVPRRTSLAAGLFGLPQTFPGFEGEAADAVYLAAVAHAGAHLAHSTTRFPVGRLKALQIALVSLIEDARVEMLALHQMPGLRRLWPPFHSATPAGKATAAGLMMRLARALIDPDYQDPDAWVTKGRTLFAAAAGRWTDPAISREIGGFARQRHRADAAAVQRQELRRRTCLSRRQSGAGGISATSGTVRPRRSNLPSIPSGSSGATMRSANRPTTTPSRTRRCARRPVRSRCWTGFRSRPIRMG